MPCGPARALIRRLAPAHCGRQTRAKRAPEGLSNHGDAGGGGHHGGADDPTCRRVGAGGFKYLLIAPAVFVLLAFGLFPFLYAVVVSFQKLSLLDQYTDFQGLLNYRRLLQDQRLWNAVLHTAAITAVALPAARSGSCWRTTSSTNGP